MPWFSVFVDQTNLKIIWKFSLSQYRCHKTAKDVENCVKSALNSNHRKQNFTVITNWGARLPQNRFGWRWLLFEELWTPSLASESQLYDYQLRSALAAKQIWVAVITIWGTLDSLPLIINQFSATFLLLVLIDRKWSRF